jgi:3-oxoadipate enol-lactonase
MTTTCLTQLTYTERGQGDLLVLLHGFPLDGRIWDDQLAELSKSYRVIVPDLRGFGKSACDESFTIASLADDVHALLVQLGALPCVLGGLSMGGYVALAYHRKYAATLKGLIFVDTRASADNSEGKAGRDKMVLLVRQSGATAVADQMISKMLTPVTIAHRPEIHDKVREIMEACPPVTIAHACIAMRDREDYTCDLPSIAEKSLVIVGDADPIIPMDTALAMAKAIPESKLAVIKGAAHLSTMEQPGEVNRVMKEFLAGIR